MAKDPKKSLAKPGGVFAPQSMIPFFGGVEEEEVEEVQPAWTPYPGPQTEAFRTTADELYYGGAAGGGKGGTLFYSSCNAAIFGYDLNCSPEEREQFMEKFGHKVLTPFGFKLLDDISVGDAVINPDGTTSAVIAVHPTRKLPCYRVTFLGGASVIVDEDHLWAVKKSGVRTRRKVAVEFDLPEERDERFNEELMRRYKTMTTRQLADMVAKDGRAGNYSVPLMEPANFQQPPGRTVMMPAYVLGVLIGDGSITYSPPNWSKPEPQIAEEVKAELLAFGSTDTVNNMASNSSVYSIVGGQTNAALKSVGLYGCHAWEKFIPKQYLNAPIAQRWALLNGLMDTDGYADSRGQCYYCTTSEKLRDDICYLAGSLGFTTTPTLKQEPTYTYLGEKRIGRPAWDIYITGRDREKLFRLARKEDRAKNPNNECGRLIESVELLPDPLETRCIAVAHPNSLYITNGFIVTHNTQLCIGLALTSHRNTLILRREAVNTKGIAEVFRQYDDHGDWRGNGPYGGEFRTHDGRLIELAGCQLEHDKVKYRGVPHDLICYDELADFSETIYKFINGWNRPADPRRFPNQRCRVVGAGNPPMSAEGEWVRKRWAPWLEGRKQPGELGWYTIIGDSKEEEEFPDGTPIEFKGIFHRPKSRTFIPARLEDNPELMAAGYADTLNAMPEPLRSMLRYGDMKAGIVDHAWQLIPTAWIAAAQKRGMDENRRPKTGITGLGVDVARGGEDNTICAPLRGVWLDKLVARPGVQTKDGATVFAMMASVLSDMRSPRINIDAIGVGASVYDVTQMQSPPMRNAHAIVSSESTDWQDRNKLFKFRNVRSAMWWNFRDLLDPEGGPEDTRLCLPPDAELAADLAAPRWRHQAGGTIQVEPKESETHNENSRSDWGIRQRIGRSPDRGDAAVLSAWEGETPPEFYYGRSAPTEKQTLRADMYWVSLNPLPPGIDPASESEQRRELRAMLAENPEVFSRKLDILDARARPYRGRPRLGSMTRRRQEKWED